MESNADGTFSTPRRVISGESRDWGFSGWKDPLRATSQVYCWDGRWLLINKKRDVFWAFKVRVRTHWMLHRAAPSCCGITPLGHPNRSRSSWGNVTAASIQTPWGDVTARRGSTTLVAASLGVCSQPHVNGECWTTEMIGGPLILLVLLTCDILTLQHLIVVAVLVRRAMRFSLFCLNCKSALSSFHSFGFSIPSADFFVLVCCKVPLNLWGGAYLSIQCSCDFCLRRKRGTIRLSWLGLSQNAADTCPIFWVEIASHVFQVKRIQVHLRWKQLFLPWGNSL